MLTKLPVREKNAVFILVSVVFQQFIAYWSGETLVTLVFLLLFYQFLAES